MNKKASNAQVAVTDEQIEKAFEELSELEELYKAEEDEEEIDLSEEVEEDEEEEEIVDEEETEDDEEETEDDEEVEKAEDEEEIEDEEDDEEVEKAFGKEDYDDEDEDDSDDDDEDEEDMKKAKGKKKVKKAAEDEIGGFARNSDVKKGIEVSGFLKGVVEEIDERFSMIEKSNAKTISNLAIILKSLHEDVQELKKGLDVFEKTPRPAKSRIKKAQVFDKFEKGADEFEDQEDNKVLSLSRDYDKVVNLLDEKTFGVNKNQFNEDFSKALTSFEATKSLPRNIADRILKEDGIKLVN